MKQVLDIKRKENGQFAEHGIKKPISRIKRTYQTITFAAIVPGMLWIYGSFAFAQFGWQLPELKAQTVVYQAVSKETEEEALNRRTEEILFENIQAYYEDAHKKALAEKVDNLKAKIASTTEISKEDTEALKAKLKRSNAHLR